MVWAGVGISHLMQFSLKINHQTVKKNRFKCSVTSENEEDVKSEEHLVVIFRDYISFSLTLCRQCLLRCLAKPI